NGEAGVNVSGDFEGNYITGKASYNFNADNSISAQINHNSSAPNYNYMLYQSVYKNYNWQNNFNNIETQQLQFNIHSKFIGDVSLGITTVNDYVYLKKDGVENLIKPFQSDKSISYLKLKIEKGFTFLKKFTL